MSKFLMQDGNDYELLKGPCEAKPNTQYIMGMEIHKDPKTGETSYKGLNGSKGVELEKVYMHEGLEEEILLPEKIYNKLIDSMEKEEEHKIKRVAVMYGNSGNLTNLNIEVVDDETSEGIVVMPDLSELLRVEKSYVEGNISKIEDTLSIYPVR